MSPKRAPSTPPEIPGFDYVQLLGSGGFADVFLYQQHLPKRRVAVKVLLADAVADGGIEAFTAEANLMAALSTHPSIVSVYHADVSTAGRPYLVMEYCSKQNLQARYRKQRLSVAESLRIGIQVAGAVETAHRAGILHRDIKPANILVTEYGRPALADFGIAGAAGQEQATGLSIPWSPPESFVEGAPSSRQTDIFALAATVYTLLAGRSPFEVPGQKNGVADLMARIQSAEVPPVGRPDAPPSLERVLAKAMAKSPADRYASALEFAWALQKVQVELAMSVTQVDVLDDAVDVEDDGEDDDGRTRVRSVVSIDPEGPQTSQPLADPPFSTTDATVLRDSTGRAHPDQAPVPDATMMRGAVAESAPDETVMRGVSSDTAAVPEATQARARTGTEEAPPVDAHAEPPGRRRRPAVLLGLVAGLVVVGGAGAAIALSGGGSTPPADDSTFRPVDDVVVQAQVPAPEQVVGEVDGTEASFTWENPDPEEGDTYLWGVQVGDEAVELTAVEDAAVVVSMEGADEVCIEVYLRRADGRASGAPGIGCAP